MTTDVCTDNVVVHISGPQIISAESPLTTCAGASAGGVGGGVGAGVMGGMRGGGAELGRRLLVAARAGDTRAVLDLMAKGAPFTTDWLGTSALHLAAGAGHADTCAVLARAGVSRDARTKVDRTPLHLAAYAGHTAVIELLLDLGAAIDCRDMLRMTPLQWSAARGHVPAATLLARRGADMSLTDKFGHTARALAVRAGHALVTRALDDAARAREAQRSVRALQADQMPETTNSQTRTFETVQKITEDTTLKQNKPQQERNTFIKTEPVTESSSEGPCEGAAAQLLRRHGITLLPADDGSTVLNAIQSGRTVVLSDAGKLMLKESDELATLSRVSGVDTASGSPVVLTATPVKSPPKPGVKVFTLNNKLLLPQHNNTPVKKIIHPHDLQVKFVQLPADSKVMSPVKIPMKAKTKAAAGGTRPAVKIIMNKANFNKLLANATTALVQNHTTDTPTAKNTSTSGDVTGSVTTEVMNTSEVSVVSGVSGVSVVSGVSGVRGMSGVSGVQDVCSLSAEVVSRCPAPTLRALLTRALDELREARATITHLRTHGPDTHPR